MPTDAPAQEAEALALPEYQPERYYAVWQHPGGRYAYMIGFDSVGWLIVMDSPAAGESYLRFDAALNSRPTNAYRLDELTLIEAFEAARAQPVPFLSSQLTSVQSVRGVQLRTKAFLGTKIVRNIPM